jgi:hypothetical protein
LKSCTTFILVISPLEPCISGKFSFTFRPLKFLQIANRSLALSHSSSTSGCFLCFSVSARRRRPSLIPAVRAAPLAPSPLQAPPYLFPALIPSLPHPFLCRHARTAACPSNQCSSPEPPPSFPGRAPLSPLPFPINSTPGTYRSRSPTPLHPFHAAAQFPRATVPLRLLLHAGDHLSGLPKLGQALNRVRRSPLSLPTPFPLRIHNSITGICDGTELAPAGNGRRTCLRKFDSL